MAVRRKTRKRRRATGTLFSLWLVVGLAVLGGGAWYYWTQRDAVPDQVATGAQKPVKQPMPVVPETPVEAPDRFEFYDSLPQAEVPIAEDGTSPSAGISLPPVVAAGTYVIQAGAFPEFADADAVKARLALLGIVAEIQSAEADGHRFHRVRIGPIDDLDKLNRLRARLRQNSIEFMLIPVAE
jgi:cell division protein FtsN